MIAMGQYCVELTVATGIGSKRPGRSVFDLRVKRNPSGQVNDG